MTLHVLQVVRICSCIFADFVCNNLRSCCQTSHCSLWQVDSEGLHPSAQLHCNAWRSGCVCVTSGSEFMCDELLTRRCRLFFQIVFSWTLWPHKCDRKSESWCLWNCCSCERFLLVWSITQNSCKEMSVNCEHLNMRVVSCVSLNFKWIVWTNVLDVAFSSGANQV